MAGAGVAALMVNTGTPAAPHPPGVWRFLRRFLSAPRVVELPRALWLPLLYALVLPLRSPRSAHKYREIWRTDIASEEGGADSPLGSPLLFHNSRLHEALARELIS